MPEAAANSETVKDWISCTASNVKYKGRPPFYCYPSGGHETVPKGFEVTAKTCNA